MSYRMRVSEVKELFPNDRSLPVQSFMIPDMRERTGSIAWGMMAGEREEECKDYIGGRAGKGMSKH